MRLYGLSMSTKDFLCYNVCSGNQKWRLLPDNVHWLIYTHSVVQSVLDLEYTP